MDLSQEFTKSLGDYYLQQRSKVLVDSIDDEHIQKCLIVTSILGSEQLFEAALILWTEKKSLEFLDDYKIVTDKNVDSDGLFTYRMEAPNNDSSEQSN